MPFLIRLLVNAAALWVATRIVTGVAYTGALLPLIGVALALLAIILVSRPASMPKVDADSTRRGFPPGRRALRWRRRGFRAGNDGGENDEAKKGKEVLDQHKCASWTLTHSAPSRTRWQPCRQPKVRALRRPGKTGGRRWCPHCRSRRQMDTMGRPSPA